MLNDDYSEYIMKPLPEVLGSLDSDTLIYLGSWSNFFDIATAGELAQDGYLERLSCNLKLEMDKKADDTQRKFYNALSSPPNWARPKPDETVKKSIESYIDMMRRWPDRLAALQKRMEVATTNAGDFVQLKYRRVKDIYPRLDRTGICIIVPGSELGGYWFCDEKKCGKKMLSQNDSDSAEKE